MYMQDLELHNICGGCRFLRIIIRQVRHSIVKTLRFPK